MDPEIPDRWVELIERLRHAAAEVDQDRPFAGARELAQGVALAVNVLLATRGRPPAAARLAAHAAGVEAAIAVFVALDERHDGLTLVQRGTLTRLLMSRGTRASAVDLLLSGEPAEHAPRVSRRVAGIRRALADVDGLAVRSDGLRLSTRTSRRTGTDPTREAADAIARMRLAAERLAKRGRRWEVTRLVEALAALEAAIAAPALDELLRELDARVAELEAAVRVRRALAAPATSELGTLLAALRRGGWRVVSALLAASRPLSATQIIAVSGYGPGSARHALRRLAAAGWVEMTSVHPELAQLTPRGRLEGRAFLELAPLADRGGARRTLDMSPGRRATYEALLAADRPLRIGELATAAGQRPKTVADAVDALVARGWVVERWAKVAGTESTRYRRVEFTPTGRTEIEQVIGAAAAAREVAG